MRMILSSPPATWSCFQCPHSAAGLVPCPSSASGCRRVPDGVFPRPPCPLPVAGGPRAKYSYPSSFTTFLPWLRKCFHHSAIGIPKFSSRMNSETQYQNVCFCFSFRGLFCERVFGIIGIRRRGRMSAASISYFFRRRWPNGFECPGCGHGGYYVIATRRLPLYQCSLCKHQTTVTAGTVMHRSRISLDKWAAAMELLASESDVNASRLASSIGVSHKAAWTLLRKLRIAISEAEAPNLLSGKVVAAVQWLKPGYLFLSTSRRRRASHPSNQGVDERRRACRASSRRRTRRGCNRACRQTSGG